jgi:glyoxylase-like metal-dependent hydrolase (beta-lactamase superfamily II)
MVKRRDYDLINGNVIVIYNKLFPLYIVKGEKNFLIDSGTTAKAAEFYANINRALAETGSEGAGIQNLLLTHTHWDHMGAASYLQKKYGFDVICSRRGAALLERSKVISIIDRLNQDYKKTVSDDSDTAFEKLENINVVVEGDRIRVDDTGYFEVIETPGHTKCSISYLLHPWRILFLGDASGLMDQDGVIKPIFLSNYKEYEHSIEKLIPFEAEVLAFPHNRFIKGKERVKRHLRDSLQRTRELKDKVVNYLEEEEDIEKIAEAIYHREFPRSALFGPKEAMMINIESMIKAVRKEFVSMAQL